MGFNFSSPSLSFDWDRSPLQQEIEKILQATKQKKSTHKPLKDLFLSTDWTHMCREFFLLASKGNSTLPEEVFLIVCKRLNWRIHEVVELENFLGNPDKSSFRSEIARDIYIRCILPTNTHQRQIWPEHLFPRVPIGEEVKEFRLDLNEKQFIDFLQEMLIAVCLDLNPNAETQEKVVVYEKQTCIIF
eukprot:TRINITY_DN420_c0_g1_i1.p1 TRINITY_DN420_c0_g1~~TRINITY_DN420_c0_g1_i1.p1  ORF type:complete len:188 (-),score=55.18 TRINITY_DN420_c0_g1_i1:32-595(-)